jgi:hypothetical protein
VVPHLRDQDCLFVARLGSPATGVASRDWRFQKTAAFCEIRAERNPARICRYEMTGRNASATGLQKSGAPQSGSPALLRDRLDPAAHVHLAGSAAIDDTGGVSRNALRHIGVRCDLGNEVRGDKPDEPARRAAPVAVDPRDIWAGHPESHERQNDHLSFSINRRAWGDGTQSVVSTGRVGNGFLFLRIKRRSAVVERADRGRGGMSSPFALQALGRSKPPHLQCGISMLTRSRGKIVKDRLLSIPIFVPRVPF